MCTCDVRERRATCDDKDRTGAGERLLGDEGIGVPPNFPGSPHRVKRAAHELGGSCTTLFVAGLRLE